MVEEKNGKLINFSVMPIMDLDDTNEEKIKNYKISFPSYNSQSSYIM